MTENPTPGDPTQGAGSTPPAYGAPAPQYGEQPTYGTPQPGYGQAPQYGQPGQPQGFGGVGAVSESDRRMWAMLAHLGGIILGFIAPLVVWLVYKDRDEFIKDQAVEALNFQITLVFGWIVAFVLTFLFIGFLLYPVLWIASLVFSIIGGMAANRGERYRYPFAVRLVS